MSYKTYKSAFNARSTPQSQPIPGSGQVANSAGGFAWELDDFARLDRFLILGSEGGTYYIDEKKLTKGNADCVVRCIKQDGPRTVARIVEISDAGRAPKNDPAILALALCFGLGDAETKAAAEAALPKVCRIGTHLFHFAEFVQNVRGWGRALKRAVGKWYLGMDIDKLAYDVIKYRQRDGWTHRDLLRLSHPKPIAVGGDQRPALFDWVAGRDNPERGVKGAHTLPVIEAFEYVQLPNADLKLVLKSIVENKLPREALPTDLLKDPKVWDALLPHMPLTAMIRNLGTMSKVGLLTPLSEAEKLVTGKLSNKAALAKSRIHPLQVLVALKTYSGGAGVRGSGSWDPVKGVVNALDAAFYDSFGNVEPAGKRTMLALDVSGSMQWGDIAGMPGITPAIGAAAMAMVTERTEPQTMVFGFGTSFRELAIGSRQRLDDVVNYMYGQDFGGTDCALPMKYALQKGYAIDTFVVYTDNETWAGEDTHPSQALMKYRAQTGIPAKLVVVGMTSNDFTIADPEDPGMLDVVGFDTATPNIISAFSRGDF